MRIDHFGIVLANIIQNLHGKTNARSAKIEISWAEIGKIYENIWKYWAARLISCNETDLNEQPSRIDQIWTRLKININHVKIFMATRNVVPKNNPIIVINRIWKYPLWTVWGSQFGPSDPPKFGWKTVYIGSMGICVHWMCSSNGEIEVFRLGSKPLAHNQP